MTRGEAVLQVQQVSLRFGGLKAVDEVSLEVRPGEIVALVGPNGAGKTTLLNCISGFHTYQGDVRFQGQSLKRMRAHAIARVGVGRTFQHGELVSGLTVLENVMVGRHRHVRANWLQAMVFWGPTHRELIGHLERVEEIIELLELERYRGQPAGVLPHGVQRLVGLARALAMEPSLLLLDEPSSGMSRQEREDLARFLIRIQRERRLAMLWIEHDTQLVRDLADRVVVMHYGRRLAEGPADMVFQVPEVVEAYLGTRQP